MAYDPITGTEIESGKPNTTVTWNKVKGDFDDHEVRIQDLENGSAVAYPALVLRVNGPYSIEGAQNSILKTTSNFSFKILGVRLIIDVAGSSGVTEIDLLYSRAGAAYISVLATKPTVDFSDGDDEISTDGIVDVDEDTIQAGDIIRLDLTSVQTGGRGFMVRIDYERSN